MLMHSGSRHSTAFLLLHSFSLCLFYIGVLLFVLLNMPTPLSSLVLPVSRSPFRRCPELLIYSSSPIRRPCNALTPSAWSLSVWWFISRAHGSHPLSDCLSGSRSPRASFVNRRHRPNTKWWIGWTGRPMLGKRRHSLCGRVTEHAKQSNRPNRSGYCELLSALTSYELPMSPVFIPFATLAGDDVSKALQLYSMSNISGFKERTIHSPYACVSALNVLQNNIIIEWAINNESQ